MNRKSFPFAAVLFDMDGVIVDNTHFHYRIWREFAASRGYAPTEAEMLATNGRPARETIKLWLGAGLTEEQVLALSHERETHSARTMEAVRFEPVGGVHAFLDALDAAGVPKALATGAMPVNARITLEGVGLGDRFGTMVTAADVRRGKPDPEIYLKAAAALGVSPRECVVFEDAVYGVQAAKGAGAKVVGITTTFDEATLRAEGADWVVRDFRSLPAELALEVREVASS